MTWLLIGVALAAGLTMASKSLVWPRRGTLMYRFRRGSSTTGFIQLEKAFQVQKFLLARSGSRRKLDALVELPDILELLAVALTAGDSLFAALARVVPMAKGVVAAELHKALLALEIGGDLEIELEGLAERLPQRQVVEFANKIKLAHRRGSPLAEMIREQSSTARSELRNQLLKNAGKNETLMLIPLVFLILPVTVLFAVYPSLELLKINYV